METLKLKNAIFYPDKIVIIKKNRNVVIDIGAIKRIEYAKPTLLNYIFASTFSGTFPGRLEIYLHDNMLTRNKYFTKLYLVRIKYKDYLKLPETYRKIFMQS